MGAMMAGSASMSASDVLKLTMHGLSASRPRTTALETKTSPGEATVGAVDVQPHAELSADCGEVYERIHRAGTDRARRRHDRHRNVTGFAVASQCGSPPQSTG